MKYITIGFTIFLLTAFLAGLYFYIFHDYPFDENMENYMVNSSNESCPNLLIKTGNSLLLYNTQMSEIPGVNPIPFYSLDEYTNYLEIQRRNGIRCPVLFLQEEIDIQGNNVYRMRQSPMNLEPGLSTGPIVSKPVLDATRDNPPYNSGQYFSFDPYGQHVGDFTEVDKVHQSTRTGAAISDNPMDINWGGNEFTKKQIESGKYDENNVYKPNLVTIKSVSFYPGLYGGETAPVQHPGV